MCRLWVNDSEYIYFTHVWKPPSWWNLSLKWFYLPDFTQNYAFFDSLGFQKGPSMGWNKVAWGTKYGYFAIRWSKWYSKQARSKNMYLKVISCQYWFTMSILIKHYLKYWLFWSSTNLWYSKTRHFGCRHDIDLIFLYWIRNLF